MAKKLVDLDNITRLASALDSRMKNKIEIEELRARGEESNLLQVINEVKTMLGGKSLVYITQAEYDDLTEEERNNEDIMYFVTDAENLSHVHDNLEFLNSLNEEDYMQLGADITDLKNNKVNKSEYETKIGELTTNITNEINRATEKENEIIAEVTRVEGMLGGKSLVYLKQAEYDVLTEEEKNDENKIYFITDEEDLTHVHDNLDFLNSLNETEYMQLGADITDLKNNKLDVSIYNEVVPGLINNSHTHENQDFLDELNEEEFAQINADIATLKTSVSGKADTEHNHDDMYYTETEIDGKIEDINEDINGKVAEITAALEYLDGAKLNVSDASTNFIQSTLSQEGDSYDYHVLFKGERTISPVVSTNTVIDDDGNSLTAYLNYFDTAITSLSSSIGDGNKLLTDAKTTVVDALNELQTEINVLQGDVDDFELALDTVDAIKLNGYSIWVGTTAELEAIETRDPNTLYFEISDEEDSEEVVQVDPVDGVLTLTTNKYQKTTIEDGTEIAFPEVNKFTEIHLYFDAESAMNLTFPDCRWRVEPNIEAGKSYEIVATYNTIQWLVNVIVYS